VTREKNGRKATVVSGSLFELRVKSKQGAACCAATTENADSLELD